MFCNSQFLLADPDAGPVGIGPTEKVSGFWLMGGTENR